MYHPGTVQIVAQITRLPNGPSEIRKVVVAVGVPVAAVRAPTTLTLRQSCDARVSARTFVADGSEVTNRPVDWQTTQPTVVAIEPVMQNNIFFSMTGGQPNDILMGRMARLLARTVGQSVVTATSEGVNHTLTVTVVAGDPTTVQVYPDALVLDVQASQRPTAIAFNEDGCRVANPGITWQVSDATVASLNPQTGEVTGLKAGTTQLTARTQNGVTASIPITVPAVATISLSPSSISEIDIGAQQQVAATPRAADGSALANRNVMWSMSSGVATVQPTSGYSVAVRGVSTGQTGLTAMSEGISNSMTVTVPVVSTVSIAPSSATMDRGTTRTLTATPRSASGTALNRSVTWSKNGGSISISPSSGSTTTVSGNSPGDATVTATSEGVSKSASIYVRTYCESNLCAPYWVVQNYYDAAVDVYQTECSSSSCSDWTFIATLPSSTQWTSSALTENNAYKVRAVTAGCSVTTLNCQKLESDGFVGGPGTAAVFQVF